jgi:hypothetical protein
MFVGAKSISHFDLSWLFVFFYAARFVMLISSILYKPWLVLFDIHFAASL